jgi:hypothetical protein
LSAPPPGARELGQRLLRGALLVLAFVPACLLGERLRVPGPLAWYFEWPFIATMLVVALVACHYWRRLGLPSGATRPHWADSAALHESTQALDRDLDAEPRPRLPPALSQAELMARLEALSHRPDQDNAIAESEALLRQSFDQRLEPVFEADRQRRHVLRRRSRVANVVITVLLGLASGWMLYEGYF